MSVAYELDPNLFTIVELEEAGRGAAVNPARLIMDTFRHNVEAYREGRALLAENTPHDDVAKAYEAFEVQSRRARLDNIVKLGIATEGARLRVLPFEEDAVLKDGLAQTMSVVVGRVVNRKPQGFATGDVGHFALFGRWPGRHRYSITPLGNFDAPIIELTNV